MKYLSRNKFYEKSQPSRTAKKLYIFCEGQDREVKYFEYFQNFSSNIDIIPIANLNGQSSPDKLRQQAELSFFGNENIPKKFELSKEYKDEVWFVIDTDSWNEGGKIELLKKYCTQKNELNNRWFIAQSNPCFELWFYYHFYSEKPNPNEVAKEISFKEFVNQKIKGGFDSRKMPIKIESAIANSKLNFTYKNEQPSIYTTEVSLLAEVIFPFIKLQIEKFKKMNL